MVRHLGLGLWVGALLLAFAVEPGGAQDTTRVRRDTVAVPTPADSAARDSVRADSLARARADSVEAARLARIRGDTIKSPLAHAEVPISRGTVRDYRWNREQMFASGAITLTDLLRDVPGVVDIRSGWLVTPHVATYFGDFRPVRVFYDGLELDAIDLRMKGLLDLSTIPISTLEEVVVEEGAQELRVHLRSWRVRSTTPNTRVDVGTGDLQTNAYRGYFGKRFRNGAALQVIAQNLSTQDQREGGDGDQLGIFARAGWAKGKWSADLVANRWHRTRTEQLRTFEERAPLRSLDITGTSAYARAAYGDPDAGPWAQLLAGRFQMRESDFSDTDGLGGINTGTAASDTTDTSVVRPQYMASGGLSRWGLRLSGTVRVRNIDGESHLAPSARVAYDRPRLTAALFVERRADVDRTRADASLRFTPLKFLSLSAFASQERASGDGTGPDITALRGEVGAKVGRLWLSGGLVVRDTAVIGAPVVYDTGFVSVSQGRTTAIIGAVRGPIWKAVNLDVLALRYPKLPFYQPQLLLRSQLFIDTGWLSRFPSGNFHIKFAVMHEYRTESFFPVVGEEGEPLVQLGTPQFRTISTLIEIRLLDAVISWQFRNVLGQPYQLVPGFNAPRQINFYGVRWDFFN